jgi:predicted RecA/RadA family phage recombinase
MKKALVLFATLFAVSAFAASDAGKTPEAQTSGSEGPKATAEKKHQAKKHGLDNKAKQPEAQKAGSEKAQDKAEAKHLKKPHGKTNQSADERMQKDAPKL